MRVRVQVIEYLLTGVRMFMLGVGVPVATILARYDSDLSFATDSSSGLSSAAAPLVSSTANFFNETCPV